MKKHTMDINCTRIGDITKIDYEYRRVRLTKYIDTGDILAIQPAADVLRVMKWVYRFCRIFGGTIMGIVFDRLYNEYGILISYESE